MTRTLMRLALAALLAAPAALMAQTPTPEGTTITNTATASWSDANSNAYANVTASASVKVGYLVFVDVGGATPATPGSPSTLNWQTFTVTNRGNGVDTVRAAASADPGATVTGYRYAGTIYADTAALNAVLRGVELAAGASITVEVRYNVASGQGGQSIDLDFTAVSLRRPAVVPGGSDTFTTVLQPAVAAAVAVSPDGGFVERIPTNAAAAYTQDFVVTNNGNASDAFTLTASAFSGAAVTITQVNGVNGTGGSATIAAGGTATITVSYTVADVAAGVTDSVRLLAVSGNTGNPSDYGAIQVRVVRAAVTIAKAAFRDDQNDSLDVATEVVLPGEYIQYKITVRNTGGAPASNVALSDPLNSTYLTYDSVSDDGVAGWTINGSAAGVTATLAGTLAPNASRYIWVRVRVK